VVKKSTWRTTGERPINYVNCLESNSDGTCKTTTDIHKIGDANPDFNLRSRAPSTTSG
jgi:hypothetical protein